jgi:hypothetical protein
MPTLRYFGPASQVHCFIACESSLASLTCVPGRLIRRCVVSVWRNSWLLAQELLFSQSVVSNYGTHNTVKVWCNSFHPGGSSTARGSCAVCRSGMWKMNVFSEEASNIALLGCQSGLRCAPAPIAEILQGLCEFLARKKLCTNARTTLTRRFSRLVDAKITGMLCLNLP